MNETENIKLRPLGAEDIPLVKGFFDAMGGESRSVFNRRDYNRKGALKYCTNPDENRRYWIALLNGEMVGYVFFLDWNTSIPELGVAVRDDLQGRHLGRQLVSFAIEQVKAAGKGGIQLTTHTANLRAQALYEAMGFVCRGLCKNATELFYVYRF